MSGPAAVLKGVTFPIGGGKPVPFVARPTFVVAGHKMAAIPGGAVVIGSGEIKGAPSHWVQFSRECGIGVIVVTEDKYYAGNGNVPAEDSDRPEEKRAATSVNYLRAKEYLQRMGGGLGLPTEAQWEAAARGPAVDVRGVMEDEIGRFVPGDLGDFVQRRFENFVVGDAQGRIEVGSRIFNGEEAEFPGLAARFPVYGWRVYSTPSGSLSRNAAKPDPRVTAPMNWGSVSPYGLHGMASGVWEWVADWYSDEKTFPKVVINPTGPGEGIDRVMRGGSFDSNSKGIPRVAARTGSAPGIFLPYLGFRAAVSALPEDSGK